MKSVREIFTIIREGERERGVEMLYNAHYNKMYAIAFSIVNDRPTSEDIVHNVVYRLLTIDTELFPRGGESSWLYYVIKNESLNFLKNENRQVLNRIKDNNIIEDKNIEDYVDLDAYYSMIKDLKPTQKEIVTLKVLGGYTHKEIAEIVGKSVGTVRVIYCMSIKQLRNSLIGFISSFVLLLSGFIASLVFYVKENDNSNILLNKPLYWLRVSKYNMIVTAVIMVCIICIGGVVIANISKKVKKISKIH